MGGCVAALKFHSTKHTWLYIYIFLFFFEFEFILVLLLIQTATPLVGVLHDVEFRIKRYQA
jgi:hypothetical protein